MSDIPSFKNLNTQKHRKGSQYQKQYKTKASGSTKGAEQGKSKSIVPAASKLPSNWEKYERNIDETLESPPQVVSMDINTLSLLPTSNSQFQLKQDKVFLPRHDNKFNPGEIFELDMILISLSLATIPFYNRMNLDPSLLTDAEIQAMNRKAIDANSVYHNYLAKQTGLDDTACFKPGAPTGVVSKEDIISSCDEVEIRMDELDQENTVASPPVSPQKDLEEKELEDWLNNMI